MAEQTFRSPGFFEQEIDLTQRVQGPIGTPAGVIGTAASGPAFVPITVGSFADFTTKFGNLDSKRFGPYAVNEFLKNRDAVTYIRVLGAGSNDTVEDINITQNQGTVKNAGFKITPITTDPLQSLSTVHIIGAQHYVSSSEQYGFPIFTHNDSFGTTGYVNLVRGVIFTTTDSQVGVLSGTFFGSSLGAKLSEEGGDNLAALGTSGDMKDKFKLFISSSDTAFATTDGQAGVKILTASLNPRDKDYIRNILNTDPEQFATQKHLLYAAFDVETELAAPSGGPVSGTNGPAVAMMSGSAVISSNNEAGENFLTAFGRFDTRYNTPRTTQFISQPFGKVEHGLFHFELLDDGTYGTGRFKVSIVNVRGSLDENNPYGTFAVQIREYDDTDKSPKVLEEYPQCDLNPNSENFVGRKIGDKKAFFNFDSEREEERGLQVSGKYANMSNIVRVVLGDAVQNNEVPREALPFGFKGLPVLKTNDNLDDFSDLSMGTGRLAVHGNDLLVDSPVTASILPPVPYTFKVTNGAVSDGSAVFVGLPGSEESVDRRIYWGAKTTLLAPDKSIQDAGLTNAINNAALKSNAGSTVNQGLVDQAKFLGILQMDVLVTGTQYIPAKVNDRKAFNNNKFTLSRVALSRQAGLSDTGVFLDTEITGTIDSNMLEAAYIRDALVDPSQYTVSDGTRLNRITFATLLNQTSSITFNKFTDYAKFTNVFYGGFDGVNILDKNAARLNDKGSSLETGGGANSSFASPGMASNMAGAGKDNNAIRSYRAAIDTMTDKFASNVNVLAIPGIRESFVTDHAIDRVKDFGQALYLMDIAQLDSDNARLFDDSTGRPSVDKTIADFEGRTLDSSTAAVYFPNVVIKDDRTGANVEVPSSVAALAALGFNDRVSFPWFAPAGFNRGSLDFVENVGVRLSAADRDALYDARINPIATFPQQGFVIFGQKTLQLAKSALDRVNVRRMLLEIKRIVGQVANSYLFEQNTPALRAKFVSQVSPLLAVVQAQSGIEQFKVVMDESNNTPEDIESNKLNGRIVIVPTRSIEFISIDFIITNEGVSFTG